MTVKFIETTFVEIPVGEHFKFKASAKGVYTKHRVKGGPGIGNEYAIQEVKGVVRHPKSTRKVYLLKHDDQLTHHSPAIAEAKAGQYSTIHTMNISEQIDDFIRTEGKGNARDAVNVALAKIEILEFALKHSRLPILQTATPSKKSSIESESHGRTDSTPAQE